VTVDKAMTLPKQFGNDVINSVRVSSPQQVMLEVRFVEASRSASRDLGVDWQVWMQQKLIATGSNGAALTTACRTCLGLDPVRKPCSAVELDGDAVDAGGDRDRESRPPRKVRCREAHQVRLARRARCRVPSAFTSTSALHAVAEDTASRVPNGVEPEASPGMPVVSAAAVAAVAISFCCTTCQSTRIAACRARGFGRSALRASLLRRADPHRIDHVVANCLASVIALVDGHGVGGTASTMMRR